MAIDLWFRDDLRNLLLALNASSAGAARLAHDPAAAAYRLGYQEALAAVALACGLPPHAIGAGRGRLDERADATDALPDEVPALGSRLPSRR